MSRHLWALFRKYEACDCKRIRPNNYICCVVSCNLVAPDSTSRQFSELFTSPDTSLSLADIPPQQQLPHLHQHQPFLHPCFHTRHFIVLHAKQIQSMLSYKLPTIIRALHSLIALRTSMPNNPPYQSTSCLIIVPFPISPNWNNLFFQSTFRVSISQTW